MELHPILSAMRRNKVGALVIAVQTAITLAILCNGLFIIQQRIASSERTTGTDEANIFTMQNQWVGDPKDLPARLQADLAVLRALPGVVDAYATNSYPLAGGGMGDGIGAKPGPIQSMTDSAMYFADEHALQTLGLKLIAGRNFNAAEVVDRDGTNFKSPAAVIITRQLAAKLFPLGDALGQSISFAVQKGSAPIVGIVDRLAVPWVGTGDWANNVDGQSTLEPFRYAAAKSNYIVRVQPGRLNGLLQAAPKKLIELSRARILDQVRPLTTVRAEAFRDDRGLAVILGVVCAALLAVTAFGIVGLTSYWVAQRRRHIGIRRALGATRTAIVRYFQWENLIIAAAGAVMGVALAIALNLWMVRSFEMARLHVSYTVVGAVMVLLLGQLAVLFPALRAASVPPALATRSV